MASWWHMMHVLVHACLTCHSWDGKCTTARSATPDGDRGRRTRMRAPLRALHANFRCNCNCQLMHLQRRLRAARSAKLHANMVLSRDNTCRQSAAMCGMCHAIALASACVRSSPPGNGSAASHIIEFSTSAKTIQCDTMMQAYPAIGMYVLSAGFYVIGH